MNCALVFINKQFYKMYSFVLFLIKYVLFLRNVKLRAASPLFYKVYCGRCLYSPMLISVFLISSIKSLDDAISFLLESPTSSVERTLTTHFRYIVMCWNNNLPIILYIVCDVSFLFSARGNNAKTKNVFKVRDNRIIQILNFY